MATAQMKPVVIIGTGLAGYTVAREFRKLDRDAPLVVLSADDGGYYSKPMLSNALAQGKTAESLLLSSAEQMASQLHADIHRHATVSAIDPDAQRVQFNATDLEYQRLVLALGADPIRLPLQGDAADAVLSVNDRADYARFRGAIEGKKRIVILGGGLIGCEFANDLAASGYQVSVIDIGTHPLGRLVPEQIGMVMRDKLAAIGIDWYLGLSVTGVDHADTGLRITLSNDAVLEADAVLSAIGLRPRIALAATAGLKVNRGIVTDHYLTSSAAHIYALGDCAEVSGLVLPFVMPLMQAARSLAKTLADTPTAVHYPAMPVVVKTPACPLVISPPALNAEGTWQINSGTSETEALFRGADGALLGFALTGTATAHKQSLTKQLPVVLS
jgi:rubredoxin-NAD+ reductase